MRRFTLVLPVIAAVLASLHPAGPVRAGWVDLGVSGNSAALSAGTHRGEDPQGRLALGGRLLFNDDHDTTLGGLTMRLEVAPERLPGFDFGVGLDALVGRGEDHDVAALPLAFQVNYAGESWHGAFVGVGVAFAPDFMSWSESSRLFEWHARGGYRFSPHVEVFVEYHLLDADLDGPGRRDLDDTAKVGFGGRF